jgi:hypothetical protein
MRLQGCSEDAVTLQVGMLAGWVPSYILGAQQFSDMTCAVDLGVNGFQHREFVGLYCL